MASTRRLRSLVFPAFVALVVCERAAAIPDVTTGLVGHWKLNETSGTTAGDSSGNGRNGTYTNTPSLNQTGQCNKAVSFDGNDDYVTIADNSEFSTHTSTGQTVAAWVKVLTIPSSGTIRAPIVAKGNTNAWEWGLFVNRSSSTAWYPGASYWQSSGSTHSEIGSSNTFATGVWVHVVMTFQPGVANKLYVNGVLNLTDTFFSGSAFDGTQPVQIGRRADGVYLNAVIDDARIYKRVLSASDIKELYSLQLHWKLDGTSGSTLTDASAYENSGAFNAGTPTWTTGRRYNALSFSGSNDADSDANFDPPGTGSVAFWFRGRGTPATLQRLMGITTNWEVTYKTDGTLGFDLGAGAGFASTTTFPQTNEWHHVVANYNSTSDTYQVYIDGKLDGSGSFTLADEAAGILSIGTRTGQTDRFFGEIDDLRIYNYALTAAEAVELYGLVGHWKLDETSGTTAADSSGLGNNGTVTGTATWTTGARGNGFSANYTNGQDYIEIPNSASLENVQEDNYSVTGWFKPANLPPGTGSDNTAAYRIIGKSGWHIGLVCDNSGAFFNEHWIAPTPTWYGAGAFYTNPPGRFYHAACVVDRSLGSIKFYLDGALTGTTSFTPGAAAFELGTEPWRIGVSNPSASTYGHAANGVIDDVRIYNRAIAADEVAELYGLVGHWKFDEASGTTAADSSAYANTGTFTNGALPNTTAIYNKGATFDGVNDYVNVPNTTTRMNLRESVTVACWAKSDTADWNATGCLVSKRDQFILHPDAGGKQIVFYVYAPSWTNALVNVGSISNFSLQDWHHYAGVYNYNTGAIQMYVDGVLRGSNSVTAGTNLGSDTTSFTIGSDDGIGGRFFDGDMDDVRIYNRALPASEIVELYGLKYWYKFDETSGSTANDSGPYSNHATLSAGAASWITGRSGNAVAFNGASNLVSALNVYPPSSGTVSFWMRFASSPSTLGRIFGTADDFEIKHMGASVTEGVPYGLVADLQTTGSNSNFATTTAIDSSSKWYYVTAVYNDTTDTYALYIDGVLHASGTRTMNPSAAALLSLGTRTGTTNYYTGDLEEFQIYQRELSATEVYAKYRELKPPGIRLIKWIEVR